MFRSKRTRHEPTQGGIDPEMPLVLGLISESIRAWGMSSARDGHRAREPSDAIARSGSALQRMAQAA